MIPLDQPLDLTHSDAPAFLAGLQGNILKSHGRDNAAHLFVRFGPQIAQARTWLAFAASTLVTSAAKQQDQALRWKLAGSTGDCFGAVLLSHAGYLALGIPPAEIPQDPYFDLGMKRQAQSPRPMNDPMSEQWESGFRPDLHALVILAHDDPAYLQVIANRIEAELRHIGCNVHVEYGSRLEATFPKGKLTIEHFGYEDGISNPVLIKQDADKQNAERGSTEWDNAAPLALVLKPEPEHTDRFGSMFVFRKLEQDVHGFKKAVAMLAAKLPTKDVELAGAMAVGRYRDGTPVVTTPVPPVPTAERNDFVFTTADPNGLVCPFHSHIRKTNPRGDLNLAAERGFRIARRGITYGERPDLSPGSALPPPSGNVGLLFMSFQASLENFTIQQEGSDSNDFARPAVGADAVIGQNPAPSPQEWPGGSGIKFTMANFVKLLGGEYFFAPSIAFLRGLVPPAYEPRQPDGVQI
jgi:Dyp-type peroxidase family